MANDLFNHFMALKSGFALTPAATAAPAAHLNTPRQTPDKNAYRYKHDNIHCPRLPIARVHNSPRFRTLLIYPIPNNCPP